MIRQTGNRQNGIRQTGTKSSWYGRQTHFIGSFCIRIVKGMSTFRRGHKISPNITILGDKTFQKIPCSQGIAWRLSNMSYFGQQAPWLELYSFSLFSLPYVWRGWIWRSGAENSAKISPLLMQEYPSWYFYPRNPMTLEWHNT